MVVPMVVHKVGSMVCCIIGWCVSERVDLLCRVHDTVALHIRCSRYFIILLIIALYEVHNTHAVGEEDVCIDV